MIDNLAQIETFFKKSDGELLVVSHISPDGDAIGSLLALGGMLNQLNITYTLAIDGYIPEKYAFMPGFDSIRNLQEKPLKRKFTRMVILDAGALPRIGSAQDCIDADTQILNIDHHFTGKHYGHVNLVEVEASATSELLYNLCCELKIDMTPQVAYGLFVGILTDTGRFRFSNTSAASLIICGELVGCGVNPSMVVENLYFNMPYEKVKALAYGLSQLELHFEGLVGIITLDLEHYLSDTENFVVYPSSVQGVALAAFICEMNPNEFKVSLRSRCRINVSEIAKRMGGGGHLKAAGFKFAGTLDDLRRDLLKEIDNAIKAHNLKPGEQLVPLAPEDTGSFAEW